MTGGGTWRGKWTVSGTAWHSKGNKMPFNLLSLVLNLQYTYSASSGTCGIPVQPWFPHPPLQKGLSGLSTPAASPPSHSLWPSIKEQTKARKYHHPWYGSWCSTKHSTGSYREKERLYHHVSWAFSRIVHLTKSCTSKWHNMRKKLLSEICFLKIAHKLSHTISLPKYSTNFFFGLLIFHSFRIRLTK